MASRLRSISRPVAAAFLRPAAARSPAAALPRSLASAPRPSSSLGRQIALARSLQPLHSAISAARLTSRLGAEVARAVSQETGLSVPR
ncbi:uncharacterized protein [Lolium perenne]|uniref:uncharacterized protein isoform X2 n=1 Tax=Lolium perenne TaxID=4522 RepID=UPI0021F62980|nr:uncharacterized protein LOC127307854 isoform X2 [Lolium perenne]